jgi:2'-5' RNA ligase
MQTTKATLALIPDSSACNTIARLAWQVDQAYGTGLSVCRLPPHISLKQPFDCHNLDAMVDFATDFAQRIALREINTTELGLWETSDSGTLYLAVSQTAALKQLHHGLNSELSDKYGDRPADFDGDRYEPHITIASGGAPQDAYKRAYDELRARSLAISLVAQGLAVFAYTQKPNGEWEYMTYHIVPLAVKRQVTTTA